jgi:hypothetical protein
LYVYNTPNLTHSFLIIWKTITIKIEEKVFFLCSQGGL